MTQAFTMKREPQPCPDPHRVLVTGAGGNIGTEFVKQCASHYELTLLDKDASKLEHLRDYGRTAVCDLASMDEIRDHMREVDTVVHLAADPRVQATWDSLLPNNIIATYNIFAAAADVKVRRVIFASSIHAVSGYPTDRQVSTHDPVNPGELYGVSKCFGEAMARYIAEQHDVSCIALRIGAFVRPENMTPKKINDYDKAISYEDMVQLLRLCVDDTRLQFAIIHGISKNLFNRLEINSARELLGYEPQTDFTYFHPELRALNLHEKMTPANRKATGKSGLDAELHEADD